jgi:polyisoprenoid-binding protein YceI
MRKQGISIPTPRAPIRALGAASALCTAALCSQLVCAAAARAEPRPYSLDPAGSTVAFLAEFGKNPIRGTMPVQTAVLNLDFDRVDRSTVSVTLNAKDARTNFPFAAEALKAASVLDTLQHPLLQFQSTLVRATPKGATIDGNLTLRGVTHPIRLEATLFRQQGTPQGDRSRLTLHLTGTVHRDSFGATGWSDMVGNEVQIDIRARIHANP